MKTKNLILSTLAMFALLTGCASRPAAEKPALARGWIGGNYERAQRCRTASEWLFGVRDTTFMFPRHLTNGAQTGLLALGLETNTPAYAAGLRPADLILDVNHEPVVDLPTFWKTVHDATPGASLALTVYRDGGISELTVTVGRETYRDRHRVLAEFPGLYLGPVHLVPTKDAPTFSLVVIGFRKFNEAPSESPSVHQKYARSCRPGSTPERDDWECCAWFPFIQLDHGKMILSQESSPMAAK